MPKRGNADTPCITGFQKRVRGREPLVGTFVKTTSPQTVEVLARSELDFIVLDAEHAPFDVGSLDPCLGAARAADLPALVRIPEHRPALINGCLDMGACGILAPHTLSGDDADALADAVKYRRGKRGFSPSGRAGAYGTVDSARYRTAADAESNIWCQIEDVAGLEQIDSIAATSVIDCLFIGPADLSLSLGCSGADDPRLCEAIRAIAEAGRRHGRAVGLFVPNTQALSGWLDLGISIFVCSSDQGLMLGQAKQVVAGFAAATST